MNTSSVVLLGLMLLAALTRVGRMPMHAGDSSTSQSPKSITVATWAVRFGYDTKMKFNHQRVADALRLTNGDVFGTDAFSLFLTFCFVVKSFFPLIFQIRQLWWKPTQPEASWEIETWPNGLPRTWE